MEPLFEQRPFVSTRTSYASRISNYQTGWFYSILLALGFIILMIFNWSGSSIASRSQIENTATEYSWLTTNRIEGDYIERPTKLGKTII